MPCYLVAACDCLATEQTRKERVGCNATDPKLAAQARRSWCLGTWYQSLSREMGKLGVGWLCLVSPRPGSDPEAGGQWWGRSRHVSLHPAWLHEG